MTEFGEMLPERTPQRQRVEISLQGWDAAYEIRLLRMDGSDGANTVVMGSSLTPAVVEVSPGRYSARLRSLTAAAAPVIRQDLEITAQTKQLDLTDLLEPSRRPALGLRPPQPFEYRAAMRQSAFRPSSDHSKLMVENLLLESAYPNLDFRGPIGLVEPSDRFEIGMSANDPEDERGWLPAEGIQVHAPDILADGSLLIQLHGDARRRRRVRLTLAIADRPAIRVPLPMFAEGCRIQISPLEVDGRADALVRIEAVDPRKQTLVAALRRLDPDEALSMLRWSSLDEAVPLDTAMNILLHKQQDVWAATVAALVLARSFRLDKVQDWAFNLERLSPHINDAGVAAAWAQATDRALAPDEREAAVLDRLIRARRIGMPVFKATHGMALELLNAIRGASKDAAIRASARHELGIWTRRARHRLFEGPYFVWEQAGQGLRDGTLPENRYSRIALGWLTKRSFILD